MKNFYILVDALDYIERHLCEPFSQEAAARACFCSLSALQKLFRYAFHLSINDYIVRRRMTQAAHDLQIGSSVTEIAYRYQYSSPEAFSRAFARVWGIPPSTFRSRWRFTGIFPKIVYEGGQTVFRRQVDISEMYAAIREQVGTYILCFDIGGLMAINEISREAGDLAIREALHRIDQAADDPMMLFRIGGDEFALVTGLTELEAVKTLADKVLIQNGTPIEWNGQQIPLNIWAMASRLEKMVRYSELFGNLAHTIQQGKQSQNTLYICQ